RGPDRSGGIILVKRSKEINVQVLAGPAIDLIGGERLQRRYRLADYGSQVGERHRSDRRGWGEHAGLHSLQSPHGMMSQGFDLEMEGRHVGVEAGADAEGPGGAGFGAMVYRAVGEDRYPTPGFPKRGHTKR